MNANKSGPGLNTVSSADAQNNKINTTLESGLSSMGKTTAQ